MSILRKVRNRTKRRALRVRKRLVGGFPRVSVFKSLKQIYAQIIDDAAQSTLLSCSSLNIGGGEKKSKSDVARMVGLDLAKQAKEKGIDTVVFDRGQFLYHGRVKSLAEGLREGGLKF